MAKFFSLIRNGHGRVGSVYFRRASTRSFGSQSIMASLNPEPKNPKTYSQMLQRARFANAVKFYKRAISKYFKFAYEDKAGNESDYNAFMRHNIKRSMLLRKEVVDNPAAPAWGRPYIMSSGTLNGFFDYVFSDNDTVHVTGFGGDTVAANSSALIAQGYKAGDIVTIVGIGSPATDCSISGAEAAGTTLPVWNIRQFIVNESDETPMTEISSLGKKIFTLGTYTYQSDTETTSDGLEVKFTDGYYSHWFCITITRKDSSKVYATNSVLIFNTHVSLALRATTTDVWLNNVAASWGAADTAILEGSLAEGNARSSDNSSVVIDTVNGGEPPMIAYTVPNSINLVIKGSNLTDQALAYTKDSGSLAASPYLVSTYQQGTLNDDATQIVFQLKRNTSVNTDGIFECHFNYAGKTVLKISKQTETSSVVTTVNGAAAPAKLTEAPSGNYTLTIVGTSLTNRALTAEGTDNISPFTTESMASGTLNSSATQIVYTLVPNSAAAELISYTGHVSYGSTVVLDVTYGQD